MNEPVYASFRRRLLAALVDNASWIVFFGFLYRWGSIIGVSIKGDTAVIVATVVYFSLWFNYFAFCEWRWGQTMGKNATGIEVSSVDGAERLSYGQASIRNLLRLVDFFVIGEVMIVSTERHQRLGDKAAKTIVVRRAPKTANINRVAPGGAPSNQA
jgi:uncharacterized RDD family membrane protein YckC